MVVYVIVTIFFKIMPKVKAVFSKSSTIKGFVKDKTCALPISVGQPYHESIKLFATIELINKYFAKCIVIVCDSLQRHNVYYMEKESTAYNEAIEAGTRWIERNTTFLQQLRIPYKIIRWDEWRKSDLFPIYLKKIEDLYSVDDHFIEMVNTCATSFVDKHLLHYDQTVFSQPIEKAKEICKNYLKEEAAVLLMWYDQKICDFIAYPGNNNLVIQTIYEYFINNNKNNKLISLRIKFK